MFIDENITKTKAFKEQLEQHAELFATQSDPAHRVRDRVFSRICQALNAMSDIGKRSTRICP